MCLAESRPLFPTGTAVRSHRDQPNSLVAVLWGEERGPSGPDHDEAAGPGDRHASGETRGNRRLSARPQQHKGNLTKTLRGKHPQTTIPTNSPPLRPIEGLERISSRRRLAAGACAIRPAGG